MIEHFSAIDDVLERNNNGCLTLSLSDWKDFDSSSFSVGFFLHITKVSKFQRYSSGMLLTNI
jgi:hypothetical protein